MGLPHIAVCLRKLEITEDFKNKSRLTRISIGSESDCIGSEHEMHRTDIRIAETRNTRDIENEKRTAGIGIAERITTLKAEDERGRSHIDIARPLLIDRIRRQLERCTTDIAVARWNAEEIVLEKRDKNGGRPTITLHPSRNSSA